MNVGFRTPYESAFTFSNRSFCDRVVTLGRIRFMLTKLGKNMVKFPMKRIQYFMPHLKRVIEQTQKIKTSNFSKFKKLMSYNYRHKMCNNIKNISDFTGYSK